MLLGTYRDRVNIALVSREGLLALAVADVPQLGGGVAGARHEGALVGRQRQRHDVARVPRELAALLPRLNIPQGAGINNFKG